MRYVTNLFDSVGQLQKTIGNDPSLGTRLNEQLGYGYDASGNLTFRTNNTVSSTPLVQTFAPNDLNQVGSVTRSGTLTVSGAAVASTILVDGSASGVGVYGSDFTFAKGANTITGSSQTFTVVAQDGYGRSATNSVTVTLPATVNYTYDLNGNLKGDGVRVFDYDNEDQLTSVQVTAQWRVEYTYDGLGRRRIRRESTWNATTMSWTQVEERRFLYDGRLVIQERDETNTRKITYTRGLDLSGSLEGAGGIGGLLSRTDHSGYSVPHAYYFHDANGNVTALANNQGQVVGRYVYDPYGNMLGMTGWLADTNTYRFSGKEYDAKAGIYYYGTRYYEPNLQRFLNRDPLGEDGGNNLYAAVGNDPVNGIDPWGLQDFALTPGDYELLKDPLVRRGFNKGIRDQAIYMAFAYGASELALPYFISVGASATTTTLGVGAIAGASGDAAVQGIQLVTKDRTKFSLPELAISTGLGAGVNYGVNTVVRVVSPEPMPIKPPTPVTVAGTVSKGTTTLYRAVVKAELDDIMSSESFSNSIGIEVKYFSTTPEGASSYAKQASNAFGDGPFTIVKTLIPTRLINDSMRVTVDQGISTVVIPTELLPQLTKPKILPSMPFPGK